MSDKKIIVLVMSCNKQFFNNQLKTLREHLYAKDILQKKYNNVDFWSYSASYDDKYHINKDIHHLFIPCNDDLQHTYEKTYKALKFINELGITYDFILRTNTSSYVNINRLQQYVETAEKSLIHTGAIYCSPDGTGPYNWCFYGVGNSLLLSDKWVNIIINNPVEKYKQLNKVESPNNHLYKIDDNAIGLVANTYALINELDMYSIWKSFDIPNINTIPEHPENYIVIPFRQYNHESTREDEKDNAMYIQQQIEQYYINNSIENQHINIPKCVHIIDFNRGMHSIVSEQFIEQFLDVMSIPRYIENLNNKKHEN